MFSMGSFNSISFATVTPSFVISGEPNFLSRTTLRPLGPNVILTALASMLTPRKIACLESSQRTICFAIFILFLSGCLAGLGHNSTDLVLTQNQVVLIVHADFGSRIFSEHYPIAFFQVERQERAVLENPTTSERHYFSLL